jgi:hypothetical protein
LLRTVRAQPSVSYPFQTRRRTHTKVESKAALDTHLRNPLQRGFEHTPP